MKKEITQEFDADEQLLLKKLEELFVAWQLRWDGEFGWFIRDGFYPGYLKAKKKILYIGRDCYDMYNLEGEEYGCYISTFLPMYKLGRVNSNGGTKNINLVRFHKLLIQISYALQTPGQMPKWRDVLSASQICQSGDVFKKASFAFMNLGKVDHESCDPAGVNADWNRIDDAVRFSIEGENLIQKEIELLDPDLIIAMNWNENDFGIDYYSRVFGDRIENRNLHIDDCDVYNLATQNGKEIPLLDCWHFSGRFTEEEYIYKPIVKAVDSIGLKKELSI